MDYYVSFSRSSFESVNFMGTKKAFKSTVFTNQLWLSNVVFLEIVCVAILSFEK